MSEQGVTALLERLQTDEDLERVAGGTAPSPQQQEQIGEAVGASVAIGTAAAAAAAVA